MGITSEERTRRNEEMVNVMITTNVAAYERDSEVFSHAEQRQSEARLGRGRDRVRIEVEDGEEELSVQSDHQVEIGNDRMEEGRESEPPKRDTPHEGGEGETGNN